MSIFINGVEQTLNSLKYTNLGSIRAADTSTQDPVTLSYTLGFVNNSTNQTKIFFGDDPKFLIRDNVRGGVLITYNDIETSQTITDRIQIVGSPNQSVHNIVNPNTVTRPVLRYFLVDGSLSFNLTAILNLRNNTSNSTNQKAVFVIQGAGGGGGAGSSSTGAIRSGAGGGSGGTHIVFSEIIRNSFNTIAAGAGGSAGAAIGSDGGNGSSSKLRIGAASNVYRDFEAFGGEGGESEARYTAFDQTIRGGTGGSATFSSVGTWPGELPKLVTLYRNVGKSGGNASDPDIEDGDSMGPYTTDNTILDNTYLLFGNSVLLGSSNISGFITDIVQAAATTNNGGYGGFYVSSPRDVDGAGGAASRFGGGGDGAYITSVLGTIVNYSAVDGRYGSGGGGGHTGSGVSDNGRFLYSGAKGGDGFVAILF